MGTTGHLASLPDMIYWQFPVAEDEEYTTNSQEYILLTPQGNNVVVILHGDGPLSNAVRLKRATQEGMHRGAGIHITAMEAADLLEGKINGEEAFPVYLYSECDKVPHDIQRYAIALDYDAARNSPNGRTHYSRLCVDPLFISRCGSPERALRYMYHMRDGLPSDLTRDPAFFDESGRASLEILCTGLAKGRATPIYQEHILVHHPYMHADPNVLQGQIIFHGGSGRGLSSGNMELHDARYLCVCKQPEDKEASDPDDPDEWKPGIGDGFEHLLRLDRRKPRGRR